MTNETPADSGTESMVAQEADVEGRVASLEESCRRYQAAEDAAVKVIDHHKARADRAEAALREVQDRENYTAKWVERGLFDDCVSAQDALGMIAHYPCGPFTRRWDVDHKPYAKAFYERFPKALATLGDAS